MPMPPVLVPNVGQTGARGGIEPAAGLMGNGRDSAAGMCMAARGDCRVAFTLEGVMPEKHGITDMLVPMDPCACDRCCNCCSCACRKYVTR